MTKVQFIDKLKSLLRNLPEEDVSRSLDYYEEMIGDLCDDGFTEEEAVAYLGSPETVAKNILGDTPMAEAAHSEHEEKPADEGDDEELSAFAKFDRDFEQNIRETVNKAMEELKKSASAIKVEVSKVYDDFKDSVNEAKNAENEQERHVNTGNAPFEAIRVDSLDYDVEILLSDDDTWRVEWEGEEGSAEVVDGVLTVKAPQESVKKTRSFLGGLVKVTKFGGELALYIPKDTYRSLYISTVSGDVTVSDEFSFMDVTVSTTSGDVELSASMGRLSVNTISGDVEISGEVRESMKISTKSGDVELRDMCPELVNVQTISGDVGLTDVENATQLNVKTISGDVSLYSCEANLIEINTTSGDISGSVSGEMKFNAHTVSGDIDVPRDTDGAPCILKTVSGDIDVEVE